MAQFVLLKEREALTHSLGMEGNSKARQVFFSCLLHMLRCTLIFIMCMSPVWSYNIQNRFYDLGPGKLRFKGFV